MFRSSRHCSSGSWCPEGAAWTILWLCVSLPCASHTAPFQAPLNGLLLSPHGGCEFGEICITFHKLNKLACFQLVGVPALYLPLPFRYGCFQCSDGIGVFSVRSAFAMPATVSPARTLWKMRRTTAAASIIHSPFSSLEVR